MLPVTSLYGGNNTLRDMLAKVFSCAVIGVDGVVIEVEVNHRSAQLPSFTIVGLPDAAVQESRERVQAAIKNSGLFFPRYRVTVNLAPAAIRKEGPAYDLPIAVGVLMASGQLEPDVLAGAMIVGELSLDGGVRHVRGVLPMAAAARADGFERLYAPVVDAPQAALMPEIEVIPVTHLTELVNHLRGFEIIEATDVTPQLDDVPYVVTDFREVKGQEHVKRALEVAAAGGHNVLMTGAPGAGKTLLARSMPSIMPPLTVEEAIDITRIYSVADLLLDGKSLIETRPFRAPHHTISHAGLVGGGNIPRPGEISLAHRGLLFLDELPEFGQRTLEVLRQPLEDKIVTISRARATVTYPANFMLIGAMNPCPCGYFGDHSHECSCSMGQVLRYQKRLSGPLLDRIDIHVEVPRVDPDKLTDTRLGEPSADIRARVTQARERQAERFAGTDLLINADMDVGAVRRYCPLDEAGTTLVRTAMNQLQLSARAFHRVLKLGRTIADLAGSAAIQPLHLAEALQYRPRQEA